MITMKILRNFESDLVILSMKNEDLTTLLYKQLLLIIENAHYW